MADIFINNENAPYKCPVCGILSIIKEDHTSKECKEEQEINLRVTCAVEKYKDKNRLMFILSVFLVVFISLVLSIVLIFQLCEMVSFMRTHSGNIEKLLTNDLQLKPYPDINTLKKQMKERDK
jgi:hypothetical protein